MSSIVASIVGVHYFQDWWATREEREATARREREWMQRQDAMRADEYDRLKHPERHCEYADRVEMLSPEGRTVMVCRAVAAEYVSAGFVVRYPDQLEARFAAADAGVRDSVGTAQKSAQRTVEASSSTDVGWNKGAIAMPPMQVSIAKWLPPTVRMLQAVGPAWSTNTLRARPGVIVAPRIATRPTV